MPPFIYRLQLRNRNRVYLEKIDSTGSRISDQCDLRLERLDELARQHQSLKNGVLLDANAIRQFGEDLLGILLDEGHHRDFLDFYQKAKETIENESVCLKIELDIDRTLPQLADLAALPWEFLSTADHFNHPAAGLCVSHHDDVVFYRHQFGFYQRQTVSYIAGEPLRIALVIASPDFDEDGNEIGPVVYEPILTQLETLADIYQGKVDVLPVEIDLTLDKLQNVLSRKPHILHFIGHGQFVDVDGDQDQAHIVLVRNRPGRGKIAAPLAAPAFGAKFINHQPGIVILQACEGGMQSTSDALLGVASQVTQRSIPAVIAMQYQIPNLWALTFAKAFYSTLFDDFKLDVDQAVQAGRKALTEKAERENGDISHHFALPVLHRTNPESPIFEFRTTPVSEVSPDEKLFKVLLGLDYRWQTLTFRGFLRRPEPVAAFLLHGPSDSGQEWLFRRLLALLPNLTAANRPFISKKLSSPAGTPYRLWRSLRNEIGLPLGNEPASFSSEEAKALAGLWQNGYLILRFFNAGQQWFETEFESFANDFWHPLVELVHKHPPQGQYRLITFLIDGNAPEPSWQGEGLVDKIDDDWQADQIIRLARLDEKFSEREIENWLLAEAQAHPLLQTHTTSKQQVDNLVTQITGECHTSFDMFDYICNLTKDVDWYALLDKQEIPYD